MTRWQYRAIHTAVAAVWGKPTKCELKGCKKAKRYEWSNKDHKYSLERSQWWQLCSKCHSEYDGKTFGAPIPWNKGMKKERPTMICEWCAKIFIQQRPEQILCSTKCAGHRNGNITKRKQGYLIENKLLTPTSVSAPNL